MFSALFSGFSRYTPLIPGLVAVILTSGCATTGEAPNVQRNVSYHEDGSLRSVNHSYLSNNGKIVFHGTWTEWGRDGKQRFQRTYEHDVPSGRWVEWGKDGLLGEVWDYSKGRLMSLWTFWGPSAGTSYASWVKWDDKGRKLEERFYRASLAEDASQMWIRGEHLVATGRYKKGQPWVGRFIIREGDGDPNGYMVEYADGKRGGKRSLDADPQE